MSSTQQIQPSRHGVLTLLGFGIRVQVDRGHLVVEDGVGAERRRARLPRVGHGLRRLVIIGADGFISLAALRWLSDQNASFVMLERNGTVLATTGPVRPSDVRLRRAQALATHTGADVTIARELISQKLIGQERVARDKLRNDVAAGMISDYRLGLAEAHNLHAIRSLESQGAAAYWAAWRDVQVIFPKKDLPRVPEHWRTFGTRKSLLTGSPRLAVNPTNATLNLLYALLESESRLALATLGLDPGLGFIHVDTPARDSLACDLMEAVRPQVDAYVLDWITQQPLSLEWFFEQRDGNCRLMAAFAVRLAETAPMWARAVAPLAEWVARTLWLGRRRASTEAPPPTRLTQRRKREAKGSESLPPELTMRPQTLCRSCGKEISPRRTHCAQCAVSTATERMVDAARLGRAVSHTPEARAKQGKTQRQQRIAELSWSADEKPDWLSTAVYSERIQPLLARMSNSAISSAIGVSRGYAGCIRRGYRPHPRHWQALAHLVVSCRDSGAGQEQTATSSAQSRGA